jgi:hypothetical protein
MRHPASTRVALLAALPLLSLALASAAHAETRPDFVTSTEALDGWPASNAVDGNKDTAFSSNGFATADNDRGAWLAAWLTTGPTTVASIALHARMVGTTPNGFPASYAVAIITPDGTSWRTLGTFTEQPSPDGTVRIDVPGGPVSTAGVWIWPTSIGTDVYGGRYFQLADVGLLSPEEVAPRRFFMSDSYGVWKGTEGSGLKFGVGLFTSFSALADSAPTAPSAVADALVLVPTEFFSQSFTLIQIVGGAKASLADATVEANYEFWVVGLKIIDGGIKRGPSFSNVPIGPKLCRQFFDFPVDVWAISIDASFSGCLEATASGALDLGARSVALTVTPTLGIDAGIAAELGISHVGGFGIRGEVALLDVGMPLSATARLSPHGISITESGDLTMSGLNGNLSLFAQGGGVDLWTLPIVTWPGIQYADVSIFSETQSIQF